MGVKGYVSKHFLTSQYTALLQSFDPELHFISSFACQPQQFGADTAWSPGGWEIRGMICGEMVGEIIAIFSKYTEKHIHRILNPDTGMLDCRGYLKMQKGSRSSLTDSPPE